VRFGVSYVLSSCSNLLSCSGYFAQHHLDTLIPAMSPVQFLQTKFPGKTEQEYRQHLGNFQISGMTGLVLSSIQTLCLPRVRADYSQSGHSLGDKSLVWLFLFCPCCDLMFFCWMKWVFDLDLFVLIPIFNSLLTIWILRCDPAPFVPRVVVNYIFRRVWML
jgi:hypothetical protein